jgi:hypothetical protein
MFINQPCFVYYTEMGQEIQEVIKSQLNSKQVC